MPADERRGLTSAECPILLVIFTGGMAVGWYAGSALGRFGLLFGWLGLLVGFPVGVVASFGLLYGVALFWAFSGALLWSGIPWLPTCGNGKCRSGLLTDFGDYEIEKLGGHWGYFRCRCGRLYWRKREEGRVLEVLSDGTVTPYMVWRRFRGWCPDTGATEPRIPSANDHHG